MPGALDAVWTTSYINDLPDSAFLFVEPGKDKDEEGKTIPRSARHFPVRNAEGAVDLPHLRNAIARIPQSNAPGLTEQKKVALQEKARKMLASESGRGDDAGAGLHVLRIDRSGSVLRLDGVDPMTGMLRAHARLTRTGVFRYQRPDGAELFELRHPDDVFAPGAMATLDRLPITLEHPPTMLDADNARQYAVGATGAPVIESGKYLASPILVHDRVAVDAAISGRASQMSCGYYCDLVPEAGTYDGEPYTHRQTQIDYNHVALVERGRAGEQVKVLLDSQAAVAEDVLDAPPPRQVARDAKGKGEHMARITIDGVEYELTEAAAAAVAHERAAERATLDAEKARADVALKAAEAAKAAAPEVEAKVRARVALEVDARRILGDAAKLDATMTDDQIRRVMLGKMEPAIDLKDKSEAYVQAALDFASRQAAAPDRTLDARPRSPASSTDSTSAFDAAEARERERNRDAWKSPLSFHL